MYVVNKKNLTFLYIGAYMLWKKNIRSKSITKLYLYIYVFVFIHICIYVSTYYDIILDIGHRYVEKKSCTIYNYIIYDEQNV